MGRKLISRQWTVSLPSLISIFPGKSTWNTQDEEETGLVTFSSLVQGHHWQSHSVLLFSFGKCQKPKSNPKYPKYPKSGWKTINMLCHEKHNTNTRGLKQWASSLSNKKTPDHNPKILGNSHFFTMKLINGLNTQRRTRSNIEMPPLTRAKQESLELGEGERGWRGSSADTRA